MNPFLFLLIIMLPGIVSGQKQKTDSPLYLGEKRPGTTPVKFAPGIVSVAGRSEFGSIFSRDGQEFYFAVDTAGRAEIRFMRLNKDKWTKPKRLVFDNVFSFNDPMLSPDETKLFFISDRPLTAGGEKKDYDIWYIERTANGWSKPLNAGTAINSDKNEYLSPRMERCTTPPIAIRGMSGTIIYYMHLLPGRTNLKTQLR